MVQASEYLPKMIRSNKAGTGAAICSVCSANALVLAATMQHYKSSGKPLLIEATANQVNQFGGYTGMTPAGFVDYVAAIADEQGFPMERIILGGDHLGPLVWARENADAAMEKAEALVAAFAAAGFGKLHLDCSMRLGDDDATQTLSPVTVATRAARLARVAEEHRSAACPPVYVVGSEVPVPGGATVRENALTVTAAVAMQEELRLFKQAFAAQGLQDAWQRVVAIVVQPGVEFGDDQVFLYDSARARQLTDCARRFRTIALEGHSTDYQPQACLRQMRRDGIAILKVGPALTFAMRDALFALEAMEQRLYAGRAPEAALSRFEQTLERAMLERPQDWVKHYHGDEAALALMRRYSLSDRCRYYMDDPGVKLATQRLFANIDAVEIPLGVLAQFFPRQFAEVVAGRLPPRAQALVFRQIAYVLEDYEDTREP